MTFRPKYARGAVLPWTILATAGMLLMTGMTSDAMVLQLAHWRAERSHMLVSHGAHVSLRQCEADLLTLRAFSGAQAGNVVDVMHVPDEMVERNCMASLHWRAVHQAMRSRQAPRRWRAPGALSADAKGTVRRTVSIGSAMRARALPGGLEPVIVETVCLAETWIDSETTGLVAVLTVRAMAQRSVGIADIDTPDERHRAEEGIWVQSIIARQPMPCSRTARRVREIVEPWRRAEGTR
ncbi:hypothetical protein [Robbsia andropogonis]|uniref:hypothetical protein n=1 Tax=Robbsia andropogonis TaxID=28092 RepID=UPI0004675524|nr:hypothetical protein [Robbsia andropogonis]